MTPQHPQRRSLNGAWCLCQLLELTHFAVTRRGAPRAYSQPLRGTSQCAQGGRVDSPRVCPDGRTRPVSLAPRPLSAVQTPLLATQLLHQLAAQDDRQHMPTGRRCPGVSVLHTDSHER